MIPASSHCLLYAAILDHARQRPDAVAVVDGGREVGYARFAADIERVTRRLQQLALPAHGRVAIHVQHAYLHWLMVIGLWRLGLLSISVETRIGPPLLAFAGAAVLLSDHLDETLRVERVVAVGADWLDASADALAPCQEQAWPDAQPIRIALSSGTTGAVKKIVLDQGVIAARLARVRHNPRFNATICFMSLVSVASVEFFFSIAVWAVGGTVELSSEAMPETFDGRKLRSNLLFMNTAQLSMLANALGPERRPYPGLTVIVGGSIVPREVYVKANARLAREIMVMYGSTETGTVAINPDPVENAGQGVCGYVVRDMEVQVVDEAGTPLARGSQGLVRARSSSCVNAYLDDAAASSIAFRDGWFYPGDIGVLSRAGLLTILGRADEVMNIGSWKVLPAMIEELIQRCAGIADVAAFALPNADGMDEVWVAVVRAEGFEQEQVLKRWAQNTPPDKSLNFAFIDAIPRNEMGKVRRAALRELVGERLLALRAPPAA